jgi:hypothetical protein
MKALKPTYFPQSSSFNHLNFEHLNLFRISDLEIRASSNALLTTYYSPLLEL